MRKVHIVLFSLMLFTLSMSAQELTIKRFIESNEITASQYPRLDANNVPCALLKIEVADALTMVEHGVVGDIVNRGFEKWVYFENKQKQFKLHFANHLPVTINTTEYDISGMMSNHTYVLTLVDNSGGTTDVDAGKQYLVMTVTPKDATVLIDGNVEKSDANGTVSAYLPYGTYSYQVMAHGYKPQSGTVNVGREKTRLNVALVSTMSTLSVTCATPNADIYVNGNREGTSPWSGQLAAGTYNIEAQKTGYRSRSTSVTLAENENRSINIQSLSPLSGAINVGYTPADAEVWLDGKLLGASPDIFRNIGVGSHSLQIKKDGYQTKTISVNVSEGQTADVIGSLEKESNAEELYNKGVEYHKAKDYKHAVEYYHKAAEQGNVSAQHNLGWCYEYGNGVTQDYSQAVTWYRKAAEQGDAAAQCNLGVCYYNGHGLPQDYSQAVSWFGKAAEQGFAQAQHNLGYCYAKGFGLKQDYSQAVSWYRKAAKQGNAGSQNNLGECYENGYGVTQDYSQAAYWYRKAADQGNTDAKTALKKLQEQGKISVATGSLNETNNAEELFNKGNDYYNAKDYAQAVIYYRKAVELGHAGAQRYLGMCYDMGRGVPQDHTQAALWYQKAAEQGDFYAQYLLGYSYELGQGVTQNYKKAEYWYKKAADQGDTDAKTALKKLQDEGKI